ncbi:hypothetical protein VIGAN_04235900 [Vigna angularis var. angularis]|uniref:Uncharacterized protein n=1 Tax=Vigna angularis var. angularis TaxID=157739 RepID=A0A0S3RWE1_PHAAN|nr:hypothetical protein VIGAN_04235900 [Vigna angularis var. angularis]
MLFMLVFSLGIDENIIYEDDHKLIQIGPEYAVHILHEHCGGVRYSKRHHHIFIMPITRPKCCLLDVVFLNPDLMIPGSQINL